MNLCPFEGRHLVRIMRIKDTCPCFSAWKCVCMFCTLRVVPIVNHFGTEGVRGTLPVVRVPEGAAGEALATQAPALGTAFVTTNGLCKKKKLIV